MTTVSIVPVAFNSYDYDIPLSDRGLASAALGFVDPDNPLEGIAKLCIQTDYWGLGIDQSYEIKPGATNEFTIITPGDPNDLDDDGSSNKAEIKYDARITNIVVEGDNEYFIFTFTPEDLEIILPKLGLIAPTPEETLCASDAAALAGTNGKLTTENMEEKRGVEGDFGFGDPSSGGPS